MKKIFKSNKGITLLAISVLIIVMLMVTAAIIFRTTTMYKLKALRDMNNDLQMLQENIGIYYSKYGTLPIIDGNVKEKIDYICAIGDYEGRATGYTVSTLPNPNDNDKYYVIDLEALEDISLINGKEFTNFKSGDTTVSDIYVINEKTHQVYYIKGVVVDNQFYCTLESSARDENAPQIANPPLLTEGMIPVKWNGNDWVITTETDLEWYNYNESAGTSKWANVMLSDGKYKYRANDDTLALAGTPINDDELRKYVCVDTEICI